MGQTVTKKENAQKKLADDIKTEWKQMWNERFDDKPKAEGVSMANYPLVGVDKGTVIHATRDFKALNLKDILKQNQIENPERHIAADPNVGGWNKFVKTKITPASKTNQSNQPTKTKQTNKNQPKKNGRGWLHYS